MDRLVSSVPAPPMHEPGVAVLPMTKGRRGTAGGRTVTRMEKRGLLPTVAILPSSRNSMPGSLGLLSKMRRFPLPLLQQKGALLLQLTWPNPALPTLLRSVESLLGKEPAVDQMQDEGTQQPSLSRSAEILMEYLCPFTPLSVSVVGNTSHFFSDRCWDQTPQYFHSGKRC